MRSATLVACLLAACGRPPPIPPSDLLLKVTPGAGTVQLGKAFPVTVVRVWKKELVPAEWNDRALAPLALRLEETTRREDDLRVEETRRYRGYAFTLADVTIRAPKLAARPKDGGPEVVVTAEPIRLRVTRALDPEAPGAPELPEAPPARPFPWWPAALGLALAALVARRLLRRPAAPPAPPAPRDTGLARLREMEPKEAILLAAALVRDRAVAAPGMTTEDLLAAAPGRALLSRVLGPADLVKFAAHVPGAAEKAAVLDAAEAFVRA
jgi:hypothetical protein